MCICTYTNILCSHICIHIYTHTHIYICCCSVTCSVTLSGVRLFATPWTTACQASLFFTISWSLLKPMSTESVMLPSHLFLCRPLLLLPSIFPSIRVFSDESTLCIRWPKNWSINFIISPSNEYSGLISFRIDWFDLFALQGTFKSLLQHHNSRVSILRCSTFFIVQLSHVQMLRVIQLLSTQIFYVYMSIKTKYIAFKDLKEHPCMEHTALETNNT